MSNQPHPANSTGNGGYERQDIGAAGVLYFLLGLAVAGLLVYFVVAGLYSYLDKRSEAEQAPVNPLVTNAPADTRLIPKGYPEQRVPRSQAGGRRARATQRNPPQGRTDAEPPTIGSTRKPAPSASRSIVRWI